MNTQLEKAFSASRKAIRWITSINFFLFVLFVIPLTRRWVDRGFQALDSIHLEEPVGFSLQAWLILSTLVAAILLGRLIWLRRRTTSEGLPSISVQPEAILVAAWWVVALAACAYGYILGGGG
jgi:hypothetical protein